jgi:hypothetical protein
MNLFWDRWDRLGNSRHGILNYLEVERQMDIVTTALIAVPTAAEAKSALGDILKSISGPAKEQIKKKIKEWQTKGKINELYKKTKLLRHVKTIWQIEKEIDLYEFYYPSQIIYNRKSVQVSDIDDFPYKGNIVVEGIVGQGKSIFFRFLASQELILARSIPVFIELRKITDKSPLMTQILRAYDALGLDVDEELFHFLAENKFTTIFLDAFDEVPESIKAHLIDELETIAAKHESLRIYISSRSDSGISSSNFFRIVQLAPLAVDKLDGIITRFCSGQQGNMASDIIKGINDNRSVRGLLTTPLMVALLVFRYRADQSIPEHIAAFYSNLFELLLNRHDKTKPGFKRPRESGLGDTSLQDIFQALCFLSRKEDKGGFSFREW